MWLSNLGCASFVTPPATATRDSVQCAFYGGVGVGGGHLLVAVEMCTYEEDEEVDKAQSRQKPVEVVQAASVQIVGEPRLVVGGAVASDVIHHRDQHGAQKMATCDCAQVNGGIQAPHAVWRFAVEELQLPDLDEDFGAPAQEVLRDEPENRDWDRFFVTVQEPVCSSHIHPLHLIMHENDAISCACHLVFLDPTDVRMGLWDCERQYLHKASDEHGQYREHNSRSNALKMSDALGMTRESPQEGYQEAIIQR